MFDSIVSGIRQIAMSDIFPAIVIAIVIVILTAVVSHLCTRLLRRALSRDSVPLPSSTIFINILRVVIWVIGLGFMFYACFDIDVTAIITALGIGGLALSLGLQGTIANLLGGVQVSVMRIIQPGDNVRIGTLSGVVRDVTWRQTVLIDIDGREIIVPNSTINSATLEKIWDGNEVRLPVLIRPSERSFDEVSAEILEKAKAAAQSVGTVTVDPRYAFGQITEYGASGTLIITMERREDVRPAMNAITAAITDLAVRRENS